MVQRKAHPCPKPTTPDGGISDKNRPSRAAGQVSEIRSEWARLNCQSHCDKTKNDNSEGRCAEPNDGGPRSTDSRPTSPSESSDATEEEEDINSTEAPEGTQSIGESEHILGIIRGRRGGGGGYHPGNVGDESNSVEVPAGSGTSPSRSVRRKPGGAGRDGKPRVETPSESSPSGSSLGSKM